jgi:hypothetical protein
MVKVQELYENLIIEKGVIVVELDEQEHEILLTVSKLTGKDIPSLIAEAIYTTIGRYIHLITRKTTQTKQPQPQTTKI